MKILSGKFSLDASVHMPRKPNGMLAVLLPGFLDTKDYQHLVLLGNVLAKQGYSVIRFDPAGTWHSSGSEKNYSTTHYLRDVRSVVAWAKKRKLCSQGVVVIGHSMGGRIALLSAAKIPRVLAVVAIMTPRVISSPLAPHGKEIRERWLKNGARLSRRDIAGTKTFRFFDVPARFLLDAERYEKKSLFTKIIVPALFLASADDTIVPPRLVRGLYRLAGGPKKFQEIQSIGHDYRHSKREVAVVNRHVINFLATIVPQSKIRRT